MWDMKRLMISRSWRNRRTKDIPFFKFSPEIMKAARAANAVEPVNFTIQKIIKHRLSFPKDEAAMKLIFMGLKNISGKWATPIRDWGRPQSIRRHLRGSQSPPMICRLHKNCYKFSAGLDGANPFTALTRIYLPLSMPAMAALALFYAVGRWNGFSDALLYLAKLDFHL
jgi:hypothetical protein